MNGSSLIFLAGAGGDPASYREWQELLPTSAVHIPTKAGKRGRWAEEPLGSVEDIAKDVLVQACQWGPGPHVVFGFSLGALVAYELATRLDSIGKQVAGIVVAGSRPPNRPDAEPLTGTLSDEGLRADVAAVSASARAAMEDDEMSRMLVPGIRADFSASAAYLREPDLPPKLDVPMLVLSGNSDASANTDLMAGWAAFTTGMTSFVALPGQHDFLESSREAAVREVEIFLGKLSPRMGGESSTFSLRRIGESDPLSQETTSSRELVTHIWTDVLGTGDFGPDHEFFTVGGNSLLAARVVTAVRKRTGVKVRLRQFYENSTVCGLADLIDEQSQ